MQSDFLAKVHTMYNQFTKAEKKVADFILQNPKRVLFMSITELADECKVGDTSVFRFCRTMGVKGYQEFKMQLSLSIHDGKEEESRLAGETSLEDSFSELAKKVLNTNMKALAETYSLLDEKVVSQTVDILHAAERIWFFGVGASLLVALKAANKFLRIEPKVYCVQDTHTGYDRGHHAAWRSGSGIFLFRSNEGFHPCGGAGKTCGREGDLYHAFRQITVDRFCGSCAVVRF